MSGKCPECGAARTVTTFDVVDYECGSRQFIVNPPTFLESRQCCQNQRDRLTQENAKLREALTLAERLCLASSHLLKGAEAIYDPRGDVGPTHWMGTCDKLIAELDRVVGKYA